MDLLAEILEAIDIETIEREVYAKHDCARESYRLKKVTVDNRAEFKAVVADYYEHHLKSSLGIKKELDASEDFYFGLAEKMLNKSHAASGGTLGAFNFARTGEHGGMRGVLDALAEGFKGEARENYILQVCKKYLDPLDAEQRTRLCREYLEWMKEYLPDHLRGSSVAQFVLDYDALFVRKHIEIHEAMGPVFR